jgi:hypothetical protein
MKTPRTGTNNRRQLELHLRISAQEAVDRLSSRVRAERRLALGTGDWIDGYVGVFKGREFRIRRATNIPRLYAVQAYGSIRDHADGSVVTVRFRRNGLANAIVWSMRIFLALLVAGALAAATRQPAFLTFAIFAVVVGGAVLWNARERESDRRHLSEFLLEAFPYSSSTTAEST